MIIWWIVDEIRLNADPYKEYPFWVFTTTSLITIVTEVREYTIIIITTK